MSQIRFLLLLALTSCATRQPLASEVLRYPSQILNHVEVQASEKPKNYLAMELPYEGFATLRKDLEAKLGTPLKNRGEAHITVITPPEMDLLKNKISPQEIQTLAKKMNLQKTPFKPLCIGRFAKDLNGVNESTYFVVIEAEGIFKIRQQIYHLYKTRGGAGNFNPDMFFPHITLGFTARDMHFEEGAIKDANSCLYTLQKSDT